jgi:predicted porin
MSQGKFDQFGDVAGDIKSVIPGEDRVDNVIAYISPSMGGLSFVGAAISGELGDGADGELDGPADHISLAGLYNNGPIFASLAYNTYDLGVVADADPSLLRATFVFKGGMWQAGVMFSSLDFDDAGEDADAFGVSGNVKVGGSGKIKAQYLSGDAPVGKAPISPSVKVTDGTEGNDVTQWSLGYEHAMSKQPKVHVGYTMYEEDESDYEETTFFGGLIHKF